MKNTTAVILMALGLTLPATTFGQNTDAASRTGTKRSTPRKMTVSDAVQPATATATAPAEAPTNPRPRSAPPLIAAVDLNHDGVLETAEIEKASEALGKLDKNGDGSVTADELRAPRTSRPRSTPAEAGTGETTQRPPTRSRLGALDANRDGMIDQSEIGAAAQVLAKLDKDRDGKVTLEEVRSYRAPRSNAPRPSVETAKE